MYDIGGRYVGSCDSCIWWINLWWIYVIRSILGHVWDEKMCDECLVGGMLGMSSMNKCMCMSLGVYWVMSRMNKCVMNVCYWGLCLRWINVWWMYVMVVCWVMSQMNKCMLLGVCWIMSQINKCVMNVCYWGLCWVMSQMNKCMMNVSCWGYVG